MTTKFKKSFSPMLICWNDIKIHLGFEDSYFVPPPTSIISAMFDQLLAFVQVSVTTLEARLRLIYIVFDQSTKCCLTCLFSCDVR